MEETKLTNPDAKPAPEEKKKADWTVSFSLKPGSIFFEDCKSL